MEKTFNFVPFSNAGGKFGTYTISIGKHMGFGFNTGFYTKEGISEFSHVLLSYDKSNHAIGFNFTSDSTIKGACKIAHRKSSGSIVVRSFFRAHFLDPKICAGKYTPKVYDDPQMGKIFYIILKKEQKNEITS